jgi:hypothetical protein
MAYPESMMESIKRLEATRETRSDQKIPLLSLSEREVLLKQYHPDYPKGKSFSNNITRTTGRE